MNKTLFEAFRAAMRGGNRKDGKAAFLAEMKSDPIFTELLAEEYFERMSTTYKAVGTENNYAVVREARARRREENYTRLKAEVVDVLLLDLTLPSGKRLRDATGAECKRAGGFFSAVGNHIKGTQVVDKHLSESDLRNIRSRFYQQESG